MLFAQTPDIGSMSLGEGLPEAVTRGHARPRIGRGGRLLFDRVHPFSYDQLAAFAAGNDEVRLPPSACHCVPPGQLCNLFRNSRV